MVSICCFDLWCVLLASYILTYIYNPNKGTFTATVENPLLRYGSKCYASEYAIELRSCLYKLACLYAPILSPYDYVWLNGEAKMKIL